MVKILKSKFWSSTPVFLLNFYKSFIRPLVDNASFQFLVANEIELSQNYIAKTVDTKINSLIIEKIAQQQEIDRHYNNKSEHSRKRRKTCLDYINS